MRVPWTDWGMLLGREVCGQGGEWWVYFAWRLFDVGVFMLVSYYTIRVRRRLV